MRQRRREIEQVSLAFLDVITCGFGAIVLLLMIAKIGLPVVIEEPETPRQGVIRDLQRQLFQLRGETTVLHRNIDTRQQELSVLEARIAALLGQLDTSTARKRKLAEEQDVNSLTAGELRLAVQTLSEEMKRLLAERDSVRNDLVGGIPVDSEYIVFIIDTSGSMVQFSWTRMVQQLISVLDTYPTVKGLQIMNDEGRYMFPESRGQWLEDNAIRRRTITSRIASWHPFSNSSPVEGIIEAIRTYYNADKRISLYVFGDDYSGSSYKRVIDAVAQINLRTDDGKPRVRIHAVGFPALFNASEQIAGGWRYATLMRELTRLNGGAFVGLDSSQ